MTTLNDRVPPAQEAGRSGEIEMGIIVEFPADAAARRAGPDMNMVPREGTATILILPAIRIERYAETSDGIGPGEGTAPGRRRRRRARS